MATLISQIIQDAYREANLLAAEVAPNTNQNTEALRLLNRYITALFGNEMGEELEPVRSGDNNVTTPSYGYVPYEDMLNYLIPANVRINANLTAPKEFTLHPRPQDGQRFGIVDLSSNFGTNIVTLHGNGRTINGAVNATLATNGQNSEYFYRADIGDWRRVSDLILTDESPFPPEFDDLLIIGLSMRLAPRYGTTTAPESGQTYARTLSKFRTRYDQRKMVGSELGLTRLRANRDALDFSYPDDSFERGTGFGY